MKRSSLGVNLNKATFVAGPTEESQSDSMNDTMRALKVLGPEEKLSTQQKKAVKSKVKRIIDDCLNEVSDT